VSFVPPDAHSKNKGSLFAQTLEAIRTFVRDELDDCLPCRVEAVNGAMVNVQILPLMILSDGSSMARKVIEDVPIVFSGTNRAMLRFDVAVGDIGLLKASDRDLTLVLQMMAEAIPNTLRRHSFSDSFFIPYELREFSPVSGDAVIQSRDGVRHVSIEPDSVRVAVGENTVVVTDSDIVTTANGNTVELSGYELKATVSGSTITFNSSSFSVSLSGGTMAFDGTTLTINGVDVGPMHTHTTTSSGDPTSPVLP
jgi:hypothetical protein